jgi:hypothetical protein
MDGPSYPAAGSPPAVDETGPVVVAVPHPDPGWARRIARAALLALAGTVLLALAATQLLAPADRAPGAGNAGGIGAGSLQARPTGGAQTATPHSKGARPGPSEPGASPTVEPPVLDVTGSPAPSEQLIVHGSADRVLDLSTGRIGPALTRNWPDRLIDRGDGAYQCVCLERSTSGGLERVVVHLRDVTTDGSIGRDIIVANYSGRVDPHVSGDQGESVSITSAVDPSGRLLFLGRAIRQPPEWTVGVDVVDLALGRVVQSLPLWTAASHVGSDGSTFARYAWSPQVVVSPDGGHVVVQASVMTIGEIDRTAYWSAPIGELRVGTLRRLRTGTDSLSGADCRDAFASFLDGRTLFSLCVSPSDAGVVFVRRVTLDGRSLGDVDLSRTFPDTYIAGRLLDRGAGALYLWDPFSLTIARVDLRTGAIASRVIDRASLAAAPSGADQDADPVADLGRALGRWIAPTAAAKIWLEPAMALSPDGSRLYLLAVNSRNFTEVEGGSAGVVVLDSTSLATVDHWPPAADFVSIATSADGRFVYASGMASVGSDGGPTGQPASVTVYERETGRQVAFLGQLGEDWVMFDSPAR